MTHCVILCDAVPSEEITLIYLQNSTLLLGDAVSSEETNCNLFCNLHNNTMSSCGHQLCNLQNNTVGVAVLSGKTTIPRGQKRGLVVAKNLVVNDFWLVVNGNLASL